MLLGGILLNKGKSITFNTLMHWEEFRKRIIAEGIITGFVVGLVVAILRYILEKSNIVVTSVYKILHTNFYLIIVWIISLSLIGLLLGIIESLLHPSPTTPASTAFLFVSFYTALLCLSYLVEHKKADGLVSTAVYSRPSALNY